MQAEGLQVTEGPGGTGELIVTFAKGPVSVGIRHHDKARDPSWDVLCSTDRHVAYLESDVFTIDLTWHTGDHSRGMVRYGWEDAKAFALACLDDAHQRYVKAQA